MKEHNETFQSQVIVDIERPPYSILRRSLLGAKLDLKQMCPVLVYFEWYRLKSRNDYALPQGISLIGSFGRKLGPLNFIVAGSDGLVYSGCDSTIVWVWNKTEVSEGFNAMLGGPINALVEGPQGHIISSHHDRTIKVWKREVKKSSPYKKIVTLPRRVDRIIDMFRHLNTNSWVHYSHDAPISCLCLSEDKKFIYSGSWDNIVKVWRIRDWRLVETVEGYSEKLFYSKRDTGRVNSIVTGSNGMVFFGSNDGSIMMFRRVQGKRKNIPKHDFDCCLFKGNIAVHTLLFKSTKDGGQLFAGLGDGALRLWQERTGWGRRNRKMSYHKKAVKCVASLPESLLVFSGSLDGTICVWNNTCHEGYIHKPLMVLTPHQGSVHCLAVRKDWEEHVEGPPRMILYSNGEDGTVKIWRIAL